MTRTRWILVTLAVLGLCAALVAALPRIVGVYWRIRASNPVRRGIQRATELGCWHCHGPLGGEGIPVPGEKSESVPTWSGGVWMMYVENDGQIRDYILDGSSGHEDHAGPSDEAGASGSGETDAIVMPAFRDRLRGTDLEDLVAAFKAASGMNVPPGGTPARRGYDLARKWRCFSCHGVQASGGLSNPGSLTGIIPGWYGADFEDLVRSRAEFDEWIRKGEIPRLAESSVASHFIRRQRIAMPAYSALGPEDLDALWAYAAWLRETRGGAEGIGSPW